MNWLKTLIAIIVHLIDKKPGRDEVYSKDETYSKDEISAGLVSDEERASWNAKSDFDGKYASLSGTPTVYPDVVRHGAIQTLTDAQKQTARENIGAGTSDFGGNYAELAGVPVVKYATYGDVPDYTWDKTPTTQSFSVATSGWYKMTLYKISDDIPDVDAAFKVRVEVYNAKNDSTYGIRSKPTVANDGKIIKLVGDFAVIAKEAGTYEWYQSYNDTTIEVTIPAAGLYVGKESHTSTASDVSYATKIYLPSLKEFEVTASENGSLTVTSKEDSSAVHVATKADIAALGNVLSFKGSLATVDDLPTSGNTLGDVYYIAADSSGYVWMQDADGVERWEQLGPMVDMTGYAEITQADVDELAALLE